MSTAHRGPMLFSRPDVPFDGIPLGLANVVNRDRSGVVLGGDSPYLGPLTAGTLGGWVLTEVTGGGASVAVNSLGQLVITSGTTDEDNSQLQYAARPFIYSTTRKLACFARLKVSTDITSDALFGLVVADTTLISASAEASTDGIYFFKAATATDWTFHVQASGTGSTGTSGITIASDTFMVIGFTVVGGAIRFYAKNDSGAAHKTSPNFLGAGTAIVNTNAPAGSTNLLLSLLVGQEGGTTSRVMTVDWAFATQWDV